MRFVPELSAVLVLLVFQAVPAAHGQVTPGEIGQLDQVVGQRVEATAVLGTQSIATRSGLGWTLNDANGDIYKIPWKFELQKPQPLGESGVTWTPVVDGGAGYAKFENHFIKNVLSGNESDFETVALSLGAGPRFYFGDSGFSVLPAFDFLFAYTENKFTANTAAGEAVVADGRLVNWQAFTLSLVPSFELRYRKEFGRWTPTFTSAYAYFTTAPLSRSTEALSFRSDSKVFANKIDLDYLTPWCLLYCPVHFGGDFSRTDLFNGLRAALATDFYYQAEGRVTWDMPGGLWGLGSLGVAGGYFWCSSFQGYSIGLDVALRF